MKYAVLALLFSTSLLSQEVKPRIFVRGKGTVNTMTHGGGDLFGGTRYDSTVDEHDESIELTKELRQRCDGVIVTLKEDAADYVVMLNRESKAKRGIFNKNNQVLVANKNGDVIWTKDVRAVASAAKDVCAAVMNKGVPYTRRADPTPSAAITSPAALTANSGSTAEIIERTSTALATPTSSAPANTPPTSQPGILGVSGANWNEEGVAGVEIVDIMEGSAAADARLHPGYVITDVNGRRIRSTKELAQVLADNEPGSQVSIGYTFKSTLGWMSSTTSAVLRNH